VRVVALLQLIVLAACGRDGPSESDQWTVIGAYNDAMSAHYAKLWELRDPDISVEEKERLERELGPVPDAAPAIAAAVAIIESNGERLLDAAEFVVNRTPASDEAHQLAFEALMAEIGPDWSLVEDYVEMQTAWLAAARADPSDEAARELRQQDVEPSTLHAVVAARAIVESNHERALEAAEFLMQQTYSIGRGGAAVFSSWLPANAELGGTALVELIGPDWNVVRDYLEASASWQAAEREILAADADEEERARRLDELGDAPTVHQAAAAALAIVDAGGTHARTREAAEFLLDNPTRGGAAKALRGAEALAAHFPDYDQWPRRLEQVNGLSSVFEPGKAFITDLAETLEDPLARATARYFAASYLIQSANHPGITAEERIARREEAEQHARGLSAGIADEAFVLTRQEADGTDVPMTFADAEAELLYSLDSTMVGSVVTDVGARRLDGTVDTLAAYSGRVVLVDFWATWCGPCIAAFPKLRDMVDDLPEERFQIIGVNVDEELDTVTDYLADDPLPWVVWHVGTDSELVRKWRITGYPTYVLIGPEGTILNKHAGTFDAEFRAEIEQAVEG